jgi:hypothetical protein
MTRWALLLAVLAMTGCGNSPPPKESAPAPRAAAPVKILQFYAGSPSVARGEKVLLCYGVENARAVRIAPDVEPLKPAYNRCIEVEPRKTTEYTLTAEGEDGKTATASFTVAVGAARPKAAPATAGEQAPGGPQILSFAVGKHDPGGVTQLCYQVANAESVAIDPQVLPRSSAMQGCFGVAPQQPTTYTLTAFGKNGRTAKKTLTVGR